MKKHPTQKQLVALFHHHPDCSDLMRKTLQGGQTPGSIAGTPHASGYVAVSVGGTKFLAHRLIWIFVHGSISKGMEIDHINGNRSDNRLANLRMVRPFENSRNKRAYRKKAKLPTGVAAYGKKFQAKIGGAATRINLGTFTTIREASAAYKHALREQGYHKNHTKGQPNA